MPDKRIIKRNSNEYIEIRNSLLRQLAKATMSLSVAIVFLIYSFAWNYTNKVIGIICNTAAIVLITTCILKILIRCILLVKLRNENYYMIDTSSILSQNAQTKTKYPMTVYAISSASPFTKPNRQILNRAEIDVYDTIIEIDKTTYIFKELNEAKMARNVLLFNDINCSQVTEITPE